MPTITRKAKNTGATGGRSSGRDFLQARDLAVDVVRQDETAELRHAHFVAIRLARFVRPREQDERRAAHRFPVSLDGGEFHRLVIAHLQAVQVTDDDLQRHRDRGEADRQLQHQLCSLAMPLPQQVHGADAADDEAGSDERRERHVREAQRERRIEHDVPPARRLEHAVDDAIAGRRVHPAVGRDDPERRDQRAERHHAGGEEMQPRRHAAPAEQHHAEERRFQEERREHFVREQRPENVAGARRQLAPSWCRTESSSRCPTRRRAQTTPRRSSARTRTGRATARAAS